MKNKPLVSILFFFVAFAMGTCTFPRTSTTSATETPSPLPPTVIVPSSLPTAELGLAENPLILALPPFADSPEQINAAREIAAQLMERTGYVIVTIAPGSFAELVTALENGNAHIVFLDPLSYALASQKDLARAQFAIVKEGKIAYGMQFIAPRKAGFTSFIDEGTGLSTADPSLALAQFQGKKPCWSEETSPSGYVVPIGLLNQSLVRTRPAAFVGGQTTVVRSLYLGGICDFGATYIDARKFPSLENEYPDLIEQVLVIWQSPEIIPYEVLAFSTQMPGPMRELFADLIPAVFQTDSGNLAFKTAYDVEVFQGVNDGDFREFLIYVNESNVDLLPLLVEQ